MMYVILISLHWIVGVALVLLATKWPNILNVAMLSLYVGYLSAIAGDFWSRQ